MTITADVRTNSIVASATGSQLAEMESLIRTLDRDDNTGVREIRVYPLTIARADKVAESLGRVIAKMTEAQQAARPQTRPAPATRPAIQVPQVATEFLTNTLIITATRE